jgi:acyl-coenzyme A synthetase/AMP-(fatty) acid ligase
MKMRRSQSKSLRDCIDAGSIESLLCTPDARIAIRGLAGGSALAGSLALLRGRCVLVATRSQLTSALALIELDGVARRLIICPPDLADKHIPEVIATGEVDAVIRDPGDQRRYDIAVQIDCGPGIVPANTALPRAHETEWIMLTSGTTGTPKMVVHTLATLAGAIKQGPQHQGSTVWATFYDMRRYGGLQIFLRAMIGGTSFVFAGAGESMTDHLERLTREGVTHLTGTPSHWRWAILNPAAAHLPLKYARLSGEIADQGILDALRALYPLARVAHAYASTEAGVGFDVTDGLEGFPASFIGRNADGVEMKVIDDTLRIRSPRAARHYLGQNAPLLDEEGFVDSGDIVELRGGRYYFVGRRGGIINVGGLKVHPEEVEAVINRHPDVLISLVRSRKNSITGAIVVADVVLQHQQQSDERAAELKREILQACRKSLPQHKVPASIRFVAGLDVSPAGKMARQHA